MTIKNFTYTKDTGEKSLRRVIIISEATQNRLSADLSGRGLSLVQEEQLENVLNAAKQDYLKIVYTHLDAYGIPMKSFTKGKISLET